MNILKRFKPKGGKFYSVLLTIITGVLILILIIRIFTSYGENAIILATVAPTYVTINVLLLRIEALTNQVNALLQTKNEETTR